MAITLREPHTVILTPPTSQVDSANASSRVYDPASSRSVKGFFQVDGDLLSQTTDGQEVRVVAALYTSDPDVNRDDRVEASLPGGGTFYVSGLEPKYDINGTFNHWEASLSVEPTP